MTQRAAPLFVLLVLAAVGSGLLLRGGPAQDEPHPQRKAADADHADSAPRIAALPPFPADDEADVVRDLPLPGPLSGLPQPSGRNPRPPQLLPPSPAELEALRAVIRSELPNATPDEIAIWVRKLQGMRLQAARDLLQLRKQFPLRSDATPTRPAAPRLPQPIDVPPKFRPPQDPRPLSAPPVPAEPDPSQAALEQARDVIRHNIANAGTPGFKSVRVVFGELPGAELSATGDRDANRSAIGAGSGVRVTAVQRDWSPGKLLPTGRTLDVAISGPGFFAVKHNGQTSYTRCGAFSLDRDGRLVLPCDGLAHVLQPAVTVPREATDIRIAADGVVRVQLPASKTLREIGRITLSRFASPDGLKPLGGNRFAATDAAGPPAVHTPGEQGTGSLKQEMLEASNVDVERELQQLSRLARVKQALQRAESVWQNPDVPLPIRPTAARKPNLQRAASAKPKRWLDWPLDFHARRPLPRLELR